MPQSVCYLQIYSYQFLQFIYSETRLLFRQLYVGCCTCTSRERGKEVLGGEGGQRKKRNQVCSSGPQLGCCQGDKVSDRRVCVPLLPSGHFLSRLGGGKSIGSGTDEGPLMATVRGRVGLGWHGKAPQWTRPGHLKGGLLINPQGQEQVGP